MTRTSRNDNDNDNVVAGRGARRRAGVDMSPDGENLSRERERRETQRIIIRNLILPARVGVYRHEKSGPQQVRINLELIVEDPRQSLNDEIDDVVSYETVILSVKEVLAEGHTNLVETLAEKIAGICLSDLRVVGVLVRIEKLHAISEAESVGVEIERFRSNH